MVRRRSHGKQPGRWQAANAARPHWYAMPCKRAILGHFAGFRVSVRCDSVRRPTPSDQPMTDSELVPLLHRIADALERLAPARAPVNDLDAADAFVWHAD